MYLSRISIFLFSLSLIACSSAPLKEPASNTISPVQAIFAAAENAPRSVGGVFEMSVKGTGRVGSDIYLNSEKDYRDQRCLTLAIHRNAVSGFVQKYGKEPDIYLKNKTVLVSGEARRVKIWFMSNGEKTNSYYYQTQVLVTSESQIEVL